MKSHTTTMHKKRWFNKFKTENKFYFVPKMSSVRIAFLGMYLVILLSVKYLLGFITGIEMVTFMFLLAGLFLPTFDGLILVLSFNIGVGVMYGFATWQIMYYVLWPQAFFGAKLLSKMTKNPYAIAIAGFIFGLSLIFWYFISDLIFFGSAYAIANIISAIPVNLVEGFFTTFMVFFMGIPLSKLFATYSLQIWNDDKPFKFKEFKNVKLHIVISIIINLALIAGIILLFVYNEWFLMLKYHLFEESKSGNATRI